MRKINVNDGGEGKRIQRHQQGQHGAGGSGLRGALGEPVPMNVQDPLRVPELEGNHRATGPDHEPQTQDIRGRHGHCTQKVCSFVVKHR